MLARHPVMSVDGFVPLADAAFDQHVLACVLTAALDEIEAGEASATEATGLDAAVLAAVLETRFPEIDRAAFALDRALPPVIEMEEELLRDLLLAHAVGGSLSRLLALVIARRAMRPDHLWQDLGLFDRTELGRLLARHFPVLHAGNTTNMRWKKYFYRKLCEAEGFALCTAPSCAVCTDFTSCFGAEDGESRMARTRRSSEQMLAAE